MEDDTILWDHGIDKKQDEIIRKAMSQYQRRTGQTISRNGIIKLILVHFEQDMDIVSADMDSFERAKAWEKEINR